VAEITIGDALAWEPRLRVRPDSDMGIPVPFDPAWLEREVTWAVTLRASMPILPPLRGGELIILPDRILEDAGVPVDEIIREIAGRNATGIIVERNLPTPASLAVLWAEPIPADLESDLNRMLTEQRGAMYRAGTELGRALTQANAAGAGVQDVLAAVANYLGVGAAIVSPRTGVIASTDDTATTMAGSRPAPESARGWTDDYVWLRLGSGNILWMGPVDATNRALTRLVSDRIGMALDAAIALAQDMRPRGSARARALAGLLIDSGVDSARVGAALGLPSSGYYTVAMAPATADRATLQRELAPLGVVHDAAEVDGFLAALIETPARLVRSPAASPAVASLRERIADTAPSQGGWIAVSEVAWGVANIPIAARQTRYLAALIAAGMLDGRVVRFDRPADVGVYRLLFPLWGSSDLEHFARDTLGDLVVRDKRGTLRRTLLAYLEAGGSQVEAASMLGVHRNTLAYRLKQIADLTGTDPTKPQSHLALHMALLASVLPEAPATGLPGADGRIR
jgi:PucR family transcriptional regulator, purine catabolism regulatory protein